MMQKNIPKILLFAFLAAALARPSLAQSSSDARERIEKSILALEDIMRLEKPEERLPGRLLAKAQGIAVIPGVIKAAWGVGGQYGKGIVSIKQADGSWSDPVFLSLVGGSVGWQIGVQKSDIILVFKNRRSIEQIASGKLTLGADASIAAGPVGRQAEAATDWEMEAEIYSYAKSKGLFAGVSVKGAAMKFDEDVNTVFYGREGRSAEEIFSGRLRRVPGVVGRWKAALEKAARF
jgi:lipid-binding SYLF domain-containing protein